MEIESRLRSATTLIRAEAFDEAELVIDEADQIAEEGADRRSTGLGRLVRAQLVMHAGLGDPHPLIDEAIRLGRELRDGQLLAKAALVRFGAGVPDDKMSAIIELTEPIDLLTPTARETIDLLCAASVIVTFIDASEAAVRFVEEAERVHARFDSDRSRGVQLVAKSLGGAVSGRPMDETHSLAVEAFELANRIGEATLVVVASQAVLRMRYALGDLLGVDEILDSLAAASRDALLPFGTVRVLLCRTMNAMARGELDRVPEMIERTRDVGASHRTFAVTGATRAQELMLALEMDRVDEFVPAIRPIIEGFSAPTAWNATLALGGDESMAAELSSIADEVPRDDAFATFVALSALVASSRRDAELGKWCATQLEERGELTVMFGLGTGVFGYGLHFEGLARRAMDDPDGACSCLERAIELSRESGAWLWHAHSCVELADVLARLGDPASRRRAVELLDGIDASPVAQQSPRLRRRVRECRSRLDVGPRA